MLEPLTACPLTGSVLLSQDFQKDVAWFRAYMYLPHSNTVYLIHKEDMAPIHLFIDVCTTGCRAICELQAYHTKFLVLIL